jgi:hypothetical protein
MLFRIRGWRPDSGQTLGRESLGQNKRMKKMKRE